MKLNKKTCDLKSCFFCQNSLKEWLPAIQAHRKSYKVPKGGLLFEEGRLAEHEMEAEVQTCVARLAEHFGKQVGNS